jgi:hypothetical protein
VSASKAWIGWRGAVGEVMHPLSRLAETEGKCYKLKSYWRM